MGSPRAGKTVSRGGSLPKGVESLRQSVLEASALKSMSHVLNESSGSFAGTITPRRTPRYSSVDVAQAEVSLCMGVIAPTANSHSTLLSDEGVRRYALLHGTVHKSGLHGCSAGSP